MSFLFRKKLLMSVMSIFTVCTTNYTVGSELHSPEKGIKQGNLSGVSAGGNIAQNFNEHKGGAGGAANVYVMQSGPATSPHPDRELSPLENYQQGERYLREIPPRENEAIECFQRAAGAKPDPHIDACIKCAELYLKKENFQQSAKYYSWALGLIEKDPYQKHLADSVYSGLMKLDLFIGKKARDVARKESHFLKAREFGNKIDYPGEDDEDIFETINKELAALNISKFAKASSSGSEVDDTTSVVSATKIASSDSEKARLVELEKLSKREADLLEAERKIAEDRLCACGSSTDGFPIESDTLTRQQRQQVALDHLNNTPVPAYPVVAAPMPSESSSSASRLEINVGENEASAEGSAEAYTVTADEASGVSITAKHIKAEASGNSAAVGIAIIDEKSTASITANSINVSATGNSRAGGVVIGGGFKFGKRG